MSYQKEEKEIVVLSLGAGVQSSALALMAARGEITPMPVAAVFSDTGAEPKRVYEWLDRLEKLLPFPVIRVSGGDLGNDFLEALVGNRKRAGQPPFFVRNSNSDDNGGMLWRKCTSEYKIVPIRRATRKIANQHGVKKVEQWIGISYDEMQRMKDSGVKWVTNRFPLVERKIDRQKCLRWMEENGYEAPPRSACIWCPYISDNRWKWVKENHPEEFEEACNYDEKIRESQGRKVNGANISGELFVHRSFSPLREAVLTDSDVGQGQLDFNSECDGMCGV